MHRSICKEKTFLWNTAGFCDTSALQLHFIQGALYAIVRHKVQGVHFFNVLPAHSIMDFHSTQRYKATTVALNHHNMINATQSNSHNARNSGRPRKKSWTGPGERCTATERKGNWMWCSVYLKLVTCINGHEDGDKEDRECFNLSSCQGVQVSF